MDLDFSEIKEEEVKKQKKVLIVEDNTHDLKLLVKKLEPFKGEIELVIARSIYQAYIQIRKDNFDIILLDLNLPDGFGISTVRETRQYDRNALIIVTTGVGNYLTEQEAYKAGANLFFLKSNITEDILSESIRNESEASPPDIKETEESLKSD